VNLYNMLHFNVERANIFIMKGNLQPTTLYLDRELVKILSVLSIQTGLPKSELMRRSIKKGLKNIVVKHSPSAQALVDLEEIITKKLPKDLSENHDHYAWE
jgi:predicted DNA-binding protein